MCFFLALKLINFISLFKRNFVLIQIKLNLTTVRETLANEVVVGLLIFLIIWILNFEVWIGYHFFQKSSFFVCFFKSFFSFKCRKAISWCSSQKDYASRWYLDTDFSCLCQVEIFFLISILVYTFLKKSPGIFRFATLLLENTLSPLQILQHCVAIRVGWNSKVKNQDQWKFHNGNLTSFSWTRLEIPLLF